MSKIWSAVLAVVLVAASFGIILGVLDNDAGGENAYAKYSLESEGVNGLAEFHGEYAEEKSGNIKYTIVKSDEGNYTLKTEQNFKGTVDGIGVDASALMIGSASNYTKTGQRVGIGATVAYVWEYSIHTSAQYKYQILSGETFDANSIYRITLEKSFDGTVEKDVIDFENNVSTSWTFTYSSSTEKDVTSLPYLADVPSGAAKYDKNTKFGMRAVSDIGSNMVDVDTGLIIETVTGAEGSGNYQKVSLSSTNIKL